MSDTTTTDDVQGSADFDAGFEGKDIDPAAKAPAPAETPRVEEPKYRQVTEKDWEEVVAAAKKTASYDSQLSKAFGTIGNISKQIAELRAAGQPAAAAAVAEARKFEIPKDAFAEMSRDFPELAAQVQAAMGAALSGLPVGASDIDPGKLKDTLRQRELEILEEDHPDWATIVGKVDGPDDKPDPDNAFRKWLAGKDSAYQSRINATISPPVIARAIRLFQSEAKAAAKAPATPRTDARAERIKAAVQPRGDGAGAASGGNADMDAFNEGFNSR